MWPVAAVFLAGALAHGSDCSLLLAIAQGTDSERATATEEAPRTESVTLLVRGMMKSRSGAT